MSCDNPKLGIVNNNMYAKYDPNTSILSQDIERKPILGIGLVCIEVLRPSQPNGVMSSAVSLPNHTFTGPA